MSTSSSVGLQELEPSWKRGFGVRSEAMITNPSGPHRARRGFRAIFFVAMVGLVVVISHIPANVPVRRR